MSAAVVVGGSSQHSSSKWRQTDRRIQIFHLDNTTPSYLFCFNPPALILLLHNTTTMFRASFVGELDEDGKSKDWRALVEEDSEEEEDANANQREVRPTSTTIVSRKRTAQSRGWSVGGCRRHRI